MRKILLALLAAACVLITACGEAKPDKAERSFYAMNTFMSVTAYGSDSEKAVAEVQSRISELEGLWSVTDDGSEIYAINHGGLSEISEVSEVTRDIVAFALDIADRSSGALDPTIYPVLSAWGFTGDENRVPSESEIAELLKLVDHRAVKVTESGITLNDGMMLDLGAVAKGAASDEAARIMREHGIKYALINLGGNIMTVGGKPDGSGWRIGVKNPDGDGNIGVLTLTDCAAVTSGSYERYFISENGTVYGHIIDPASGYPVDNDLLSTTIISTDGGLCDALSTALFVMGSERAEEFWREHSAELSGFDMLLITKSGEVIITEGAAERFSLSDKSLTLKVIEK